MTTRPPQIAIADLFRVYLRIGLLSFGGPAGQIALMHREIVEDRGWLSEEDYLNALSFCMLLPGPEAMQLATYSGWRLRGVTGGLIAGLLFVLPGAALILALAMAYATFGMLDWVAALFIGIKAAVVIVVIEALMKVSRRALRRRDHWLVAGAAFVAIFFLNAPFPLIVVLAALYGFLTATPPSETAQLPDPVDWRRSISTALFWLALWWGPLALLALALPDSVLVPVGLFFAKLAVVTFGGAYAVLAYMAQQAVEVQGWLSAGQMIDGLGLAETTPGPLILVTEFVGYLAGHADGGIPLGIAAAIVTLWMTFVPCFLWIFTGAPYIARLSGMPRLKGALSGVTASVVGVILNLTLWFALHVIFAQVDRVTLGPLHLWLPDATSFNPLAVGLTALAAALLLGLKMGLGRVLILSALAGMALSLIV